MFQHKRTKRIVVKFSSWIVDNVLIAKRTIIGLSWRYELVTFFSSFFFLILEVRILEVKVKWKWNFKVTNKTSHEIYSPLCVWYIEVRCNILKFVSVVNLIIRDGMQWRKLRNILFDRLIRSRNSWYINAIIYMWWTIKRKVMHNNRYKRERGEKR